MVLAKKANLLTQLIATYEAAMNSADMEDQAELTSWGDQADKLLAELLPLDQRLHPTQSTPEIDALVDQAKLAHQGVLHALHLRKEKISEMLRDSKTYKKALKSYHSPNEKTGRRINVTDV